MAVFRIERTRDYTVMSNHHLRNANLSLKAKGLLDILLTSFPYVICFSIKSITSSTNKRKQGYKAELFFNELKNIF